MKNLIIASGRRTSGILRVALSSTDYALRVASSQEEGLTDVVNWMPQIILADADATALNGVSFCKRLREKSNAPLIVLAAYPSAASMVEILDAGADDYISNPFSVPELLARVRRWSQRSGLRDLRPGAISS